MYMHSILYARATEPQDKIEKREQKKAKETERMAVYLTTGNACSSLIKCVQHYESAL